jgi:membrane-associated phospholipid phosphatase
VIVLLLKRVSCLVERARPTAGYVSLVLATGAVVILTGAALVVGVLPGDVWARDMLVTHAPPPVKHAMRWFTPVGEWRVLLPGTLLLVAASYRVRRWWWVWVALIGLAAISEWALKPVVGRPRPVGLGFSFPSGHAAAAAAYFGAVIHAAADLRPAARAAVRAAAAVMIVLVALARVLLEAHWPSDVLGGVAMGLACVSAAVLISESTAHSPAGPTSRLPPSHD